MFDVRGVTAGYGDTIVLRDVSVALPDGSVVVLIGPNGAGKTTLLRTASGLLAPRAGSVSVDGVDLTGKPATNVDVGSYRLYTLHSSDMTTSDTLHLRFTPGVQAYAFTFG